MKVYRHAPVKSTYPVNAQKPSILLHWYLPAIPRSTIPTRNRVRVRFKVTDRVSDKVRVRVRVWIV